MDNEFLSLKNDVDGLIIQQSLSIAHSQTLTEIVFGVFSEILTPEQSKTVEQNFFFVLQEKTDKALSELEGAVSKTALLKSSYDFFEYIQSKKR